jgi:5'-nucleotidase
VFSLDSCRVRVLRGPAFSSVPFIFAAALLLAPASAQTTRAVTVQLLAINDLHGNLEPPPGPSGRTGQTPSGGAEYLSTHLANDMAANPNSIVVAAGDLIGASPLVSALFHDEPTIAALNVMRLAVASVGNHEFDHGLPELLRMQTGGCHPVDGCTGGDSFAGAGFEYLAANVVATASGTTIFPATTVRTIGGVKVGFIGETLRGTPGIVSADAVRGLAFLDEADTANAAAAALKQQGVNAIVLLVHEGGRQTASADPNGCRGFSGGIVPIARKLSPDIKVVISGHTHEFYNCTIAGHSVTSASSFGRMITRVNLTIDPANDAITGVAAVNETVTRDVPKDPAVTRIIARYAALSDPIAKRVVGAVSGDLTRRSNRAGESALGDTVADAQLAAVESAAKGGAVVAFMNPGGLRADLMAASQPGGEAPGQVTYGELFNVDPFGNVITVMTLTGDGIRRLLEQQFGPAPGASRILQASRGLTYSYKLNAPAGGHVVPGSIRIGARALAAGASVRVAANSFLATGGDGFTVFTEGTNRVGRDISVDALVAYFRAHSPVAPGPQNRIVRLD